MSSLKFLHIWFSFAVIIAYNSTAFLQLRLSKSVNEKKIETIEILTHIKSNSRKLLKLYIYLSVVDKKFLFFPLVALKN